MSFENALIVFAKLPELGKVKTRLAKDVGDEEALAIYQKLLAWTKQETSKSSADLFVYYTPEIAAEDNWKAEKRLQSTGDLGQRMAVAFREQLNRYKKVCIIGADCAGLTTEIIDSAFSHLDRKDFVIGPANDGGYYLLGMKQFYESLFTGITWSSDQVLSQTISEIQTMDKEYVLLQELIDVDTIEDWELVANNFK